MNAADGVINIRETQAKLFTGRVIESAAPTVWGDWRYREGYIDRETSRHVHVKTDAGEVVDCYYCGGAEDAITPAPGDEVYGISTRRMVDSWKENCDSLSGVLLNGDFYDEVVCKSEAERVEEFIEYAAYRYNKYWNSSLPARIRPASGDASAIAEQMSRLRGALSDGVVKITSGNVEKCDTVSGVTTATIRAEPLPDTSPFLITCVADYHMYVERKMTVLLFSKWNPALNRDIIYAFQLSGDCETWFDSLTPSQKEATERFLSGHPFRAIGLALFYSQSVFTEKLPVQGGDGGLKWLVRAMKIEYTSRANPSKTPFDIVRLLSVGEPSETYVLSSVQRVKDRIGTVLSASIGRLQNGGYKLKRQRQIDVGTIPAPVRESPTEADDEGGDSCKTSLLRVYDNEFMQTAGKNFWININKICQDLSSGKFYNIAFAVLRFIGIFRYATSYILEKLAYFGFYMEEADALTENDAADMENFKKSCAASPLTYAEAGEKFDTEIIKTTNNNLIKKTLIYLSNCGLLIVSRFESGENGRSSNTKIYALSSYGKELLNARGVSGIQKNDVFMYIRTTYDIKKSLAASQALMAFQYRLRGKYVTSLKKVMRSYAVRSRMEINSRTLITRVDCFFKATGISSAPSSEESVTVFIEAPRNIDTGISSKFAESNQREKLPRLLQTAMLFAKEQRTGVCILLVCTDYEDMLRIGGIIGDAETSVASELSSPLSRVRIIYTYDFQTNLCSNTVFYTRASDGGMTRDADVCGILKQLADEVSVEKGGDDAV